MQPCPGCSRPLRVDASACPFCGAAVHLARAPLPSRLALVVALGLATCSHDNSTSSDTQSGTNPPTTGNVETSADDTSPTGMSASSTSASSTSASTTVDPTSTTTTGSGEDTLVTSTTVDTSGSESSTGDTGTTTTDPTDDTAQPPYGAPTPSSRWA